MKPLLTALASAMLACLFGGTALAGPDEVSDGAQQPPAQKFPGQIELAQGIACWNELKLDCARRQLGQALSKLDPARDPAYIAHVRRCRLILALINITEDKLGEAEEEFYRLLLIDPAYELPEDRYPPKTHYVFEQARRRLTKSSRSQGHGDQQEPARKNKVPVDTNSGVTKKARDAGGSTAMQGHDHWQVLLEPRLRLLFGKDAEAFYPGPEAGLKFGRTVGNWVIGVCIAYAYHAGRNASGKLEQAAAGAQGGYVLNFGRWSILLLAGLSAVSVAWQGRYENWGIEISSSASVRLRVARGLNLSAGLRPSMVFLSTGASATLGVATGLEYDW